jgi:hypothetical protein
MRGKRWTNPKLATAVDIKTLVSRVAGYCLYERDQIAEPGQPEIGIPELCTLMESLLTQMPKSARKGQYKALQAEVKCNTETCFAEHFSNTERIHMLSLMLDRGDIELTAFDKWMREIQDQQERDHRDAAKLFLNLYSKAFLAKPGSQPKHRPKGRASRETALLDFDVINRTLDAVTKDYDTSEGPFRGYRLEDAKAELRSQLKAVLQERTAVTRGDGTEKSNIDTHAKRLLRKLDEMHRQRR